MAIARAPQQLLPTSRDCVLDFDVEDVRNRPEQHRLVALGMIEIGLQLKLGTTA